MDISGAIASVLWSESSSGDQAGRPQSFEDLARLVAEERLARKKSLAEAQKQLDWRFVHFTEELQRRIDGLENRVGAAGKFRGSCEQEQPLRCSLSSERLPVPSCSSEGRSGGTEEQRMHLLEGRVAIAESRIAEVQRWGKAMEAELAEDASERRLRELDASNGHLERRLLEVEQQLGERRKVTGRLTPVERLSVDGQGSSTCPGPRSSQASTSMQSTTSTGSSPAGRKADGLRPPLSPTSGSKAAERLSPVLLLGEGSVAKLSEGCSASSPASAASNGALR